MVVRQLATFFVVVVVVANVAKTTFFGKGVVAIVAVVAAVVAAAVAVVAWRSCFRRFWNVKNCCFCRTKVSKCGQMPPEMEVFLVVVGGCGSCWWLFLVVGGGCGGCLLLMVVVMVVGGENDFNGCWWCWWLW